ncbi:MAG TPA: tagaturonate reductase [Chitinophagaceae bacterium]|nr:tagaturonate reductase [Chitinophagaceae bacterium]
MQLSKENLRLISQKNDLEIPDVKICELPEKVLQFGTGVLLRALPDYFIDKANKAGVFNGRVVVVKSTESDSSAFGRQDGLYTICVRGVEGGQTIEENIINASISRVLSANLEWNKILACAQNQDLKIVISNTTEVGIQLVEEMITREPPVSFPGKLLAFLIERYKAFDGDPETGMVIIPTELITDNGTKLKSILIQLSKLNKLDEQFISWLERHNRFCNSLVDRIVPGKPGREESQKLERQLGYQDDLLTMSEVFRLWAIEGDDKVRDILQFSTIDDGMIIAPDITLFKELKLRLLNGTHTFNCGLAFLSGFNITREAVADKIYSSFVKKLMHQEIAPAIPYQIDGDQKIDFANKVFERFCNPYINHQWLSITVQNTSKMKMRNVPLLIHHYELQDTPPVCMATGFAGFLLFMKAIKKEGDKYFGQRKGELYEIKDDSAEYFSELWKDNKPEQVVDRVLSNDELWGARLDKLPGFSDAVKDKLIDMGQYGVLETVIKLVNNIN